MPSATQSASGQPIKAFFDIDWSGDIAAKLLSAVERLNKPVILLRTIGRKLVVSMQRNIDESHAPDGTEYAPLKRPRTGGVHGPASDSLKPLYDTGALYRDLQYDIDESDNSVSIGHTVSTFYGKYQQEGTKTIPARPFIGIAKGDLPDLDDSTLQFTIASLSGDALSA